MLKLLVTKSSGNCLLPESAWHYKELQLLASWIVRNSTAKFGHCIASDKYEQNHELKERHCICPQLPLHIFNSPINVVVVCRIVLQLCRIKRAGTLHRVATVCKRQIFCIMSWFLYAVCMLDLLWDNDTSICTQKKSQNSLPQVLLLQYVRHCLKGVLARCTRSQVRFLGCATMFQGGITEGYLCTHP